LLSPPPGPSAEDEGAGGLPPEPPAPPIPPGEGPPQPQGPRFCTNCGAELAPNARFCSQCGERVWEATAAFSNYPLIFEVEYPQKLSRLLIFVKWLLAFPQYLVVYALGQVSGLIAFVAFFCILFTKRYPRGLFNLVVGFNRWGANVSAYTNLLRDEYPPFTTEEGRYPVRYDVDYAEKLSRWLIWIKWFVVFPHYIVLAFVGIANFFVLFIAWFAILFTGRFPKGLFNFAVGYTRWNLRVGAYTSLMRDEFPPYSMSADARPGGWKSMVLGAVIGIAGIAALVVAVVVLALAVSGDTKEVPVSYEALRAGRSSRAISLDGTVVTLLQAEDPYTTRPTPGRGERAVAFEFLIENRDSIFTSVTEETFRLEDTSGHDYRPVRLESNTLPDGGFLEQGGVATVTVVFEIDEFEDPAELTYSPRFVELLGERVKFIFRSINNSD